MPSTGNLANYSRLVKSWLLEENLQSFYPNSIIVNYILNSYRKWTGQRESSGIKGTESFLRGSRFYSQHPHGSLQPSVTPDPGNLTLSHRHACRLSL